MKIDRIYWGVVFFLVACQAQAALVTGTVVDNDTSAPIANVLVTLQGGAQQTTTASDGSFTLDLSGTNLTIVSAVKGYYYRSANVNPPENNVQMLMSSVPVSDNAGYHIQAPDNCASCHPKQYSEWNDSPMALAGYNTWVHDIYAGNGTVSGMGGFVYTRDSKFAASNPESECASCHQPQHWIENPFAAMDADTVNPTPGVEHGVSCEVCHKVADIDENQINAPGIFPGAVTYNRPSGFQQVQYGVLGDVSYSVPGMMQAAYQPQLRAELCATCHQDAADPLENHSFSGVISEPTYLEWKNSAYADPQSPVHADCVDCHMGAAEDNAVCSTITPPDRPLESVRNHQILGTTPDYLENAVALDLEVIANATELQVNVAINNNQTGHHVPTGVTVRNMILLVEAWEDGQDPVNSPLPYTGTQLVHELGGIGDPAQGYYANLPGKLYAKVNHDENGNGPTFFTDATGIQFDNRIPALQTDTTSYSFSLPQQAATIHVRARLIYRRAFRFLVDAKQWTQDGHGNPLQDVAAPHYGHLMEESQQTVVAGAMGSANSIPSTKPYILFLLGLMLAGMGAVVLRKS